ncbi:MAG: hypothetical protein P4L16_05985 [Chlamydiales bacterium]|nr:hypothetical protein [Chlamydiales bacterium]
MKRKGYIFFAGLIVGLISICSPCVAAQSSESVGSQVPIANLNEQLNVVNQQIEAILHEARALQEDKELYNRESEDAEHRDPMESKRLGRLSGEDKEKLQELLFQLEKLLKQRAFIEEELGHPNDMDQSPYQP